MKQTLLILAALLFLASYAAAQTTQTADHIRARSSFRIGAQNTVAATSIRDTMPATPGTELLTAEAIYQWVTDNFSGGGGGGGADLTFSGASSPFTLNSNSGTDVTFASGGIVTLSRSSNQLTISATEVDGSTANELNTAFSVVSTNLRLVDAGGNLDVPVTSIAPVQAVAAGTGISISGTTTRTITNDAPDQMVSIVATGIASATGTYPNFTIGAIEVDGSISNELQTLSVATGTATLSNGGGSVTIAGAGINSVGTAGSTITITGTEVDGSLSNEGSLTVGAGTGSTSVISSNTSGSTDVTLTAAGINTISEAGNVITITATEVDGSTTNEIQSIANTSDATSHTVTLSGPNGSLQLVEGANITLTTTGTSGDGIVTIAASGGGGGGSQTLQNTLDLGNTSDTNIEFDDPSGPLSGVGDAIAKNWITIKPLVQTGHDGENFYMGTSATENVSGINDVFMMGWNLTAGGGPSTLGKPGVGFSLEQRYRPGGEDLTEAHLFHIGIDGVQRRLYSYTMDNATNLTGLYHTVASLGLRTYGASDNYFRVIGGTDTENGSLAFNTATGGLALDYTTTSTAQWDIINYKSGGAPAINYTGWGSMQFGTISAFGLPATSTWTMADGSFVQYSTTQHRWSTAGANQPIRLKPGTAEALEAWYDGTSYGVTMGAAVSGTNPLARLAVSGNTTTQFTYSAVFHNSTGTNYTLAIRNDKRVGINTGSPTGTLTVFDAGDAILNLQTTATGIAITDGFSIALEDATKDVYFNQRENANWRLYVNGGERITVSPSGAVKFGAYTTGAITGTPVNALATDASGNVIQTALATGDITNGGNTAAAAITIGTNDAFGLNFETNNVTRFSITGGASTGGAWTATDVTANTNTVEIGGTMVANSSGAATDGFGVGLLLQGESSTTNGQDMARIATSWTVSSHSTRVANYTIQLADNTALAERFKIAKAGSTWEMYIGGGSTAYSNVGISPASSFQISGSPLTLGGSNGGTIMTDSKNDAKAISIISSNTAASGVGGINIGNTVSHTQTSGTRNYVNHDAGFAPTSGTAVHNSFVFSGTFNQTGGANGITRGIYLNQTLTAVADMRLLEIAANGSNTKGVYQTGASVTNNFVGGTTFGATSAPNAAAAIDIASTTKVLVLSRVTEAERDAISSPPNGSIIYNTTTDKFQGRAAGAWVDLH